MKTLIEHNQDTLNSLTALKYLAHPAGVACPKCATEMQLTCPGQTLLSNPPQREVYCPACGYKGYKY